MSDRQDQIVKAWDAISHAYQDRYKIPTADIGYGPMAGSEADHKIIGSLKGLRVLDVGCGGGQNSIAAWRLGAARVVAIDPSESQIGFAREIAREAGADVDFRVLPAERIGEIGERFDLVLSVYSLMFVERLGDVLGAIRDSLVPGGRFVISVDHPFRIAGEWEDGRFIVTGYFEEGWRSWSYAFPEKAHEVEMHRYHRTMSSWIGALFAGGLNLMGIAEPNPTYPADSFGRVSKYGIDSEHNAFAPSRLRRVPGTVIFWGVRS